MEETKLEFFKEAINCLRAPVREPVAATPQDASEYDISHFVKSIESTLRQMPGRQLILAKKRINDVIFEVSFKLPIQFILDASKGLFIYFYFLFVFTVCQVEMEA